MSALWAAVVAASLGCYALKLAGLSLPSSVLGHPRVQRTALLLPVAMLSALIVTDLFSTGRRYSLDWQLLAGVALGGVALRLRQSLIVVFVVGVVSTAILRLLIS